MLNIYEVIARCGPGHAILQEPDGVYTIYLPGPNVLASPIRSINRALELTDRVLPLGTCTLVSAPHTHVAVCENDPTAAGAGTESSS